MIKNPECDEKPLAIHSNSSKLTNSTPRGAVNKIKISNKTSQVSLFDSTQQAFFFMVKIFLPKEYRSVQCILLVLVLNRSTVL